MICASWENFPHIQEFNQKVRKKFADFKICLIFAVPFHQMRDVAQLKSAFTYCGNSSVGRARPCQGRGREFESRFPLFRKALQRKLRCFSSFIPAAITNRFCQLYHISGDSTGNCLARGGPFPLCRPHALIASCCCTNTYKMPLWLASQKNTRRPRPLKNTI